jgi:hypothetical protein
VAETCLTDSATIQAGKATNADTVRPAGITSGSRFIHGLRVQSP